jgi:penicillin amidase
LRSKDKFNIQDFKDLHNNNYNLKAAELLPIMIATMDTSELTEPELQIFNEVKSWDYYNDIDKLGPTIWEKWWQKVYPLIWDEIDYKNEAIASPFSYQTIYILNHDPENEFMDIIDTEIIETAKDIYLLAFTEAAEDLLQWKEKNGAYYWGKYKATYLGHLLQGLPAFSRFDLPIGGNGNIVNATSKNHGPSWRMIVEMSSPPKAIGVYPGGQSGNPGSVHYDDFVDMWVNGEYLDLLFMQNNTRTDAIIQLQILNPRP